jgi:hypothetical protein
MGQFFGCGTDYPALNTLEHHVSTFGKTCKVHERMIVSIGVGK